ncbi:helix-turn-helix transcriptional regulator [Ascidiimonas aurantiaca]|uniref:helix-turn-helix domain-containing protein n=1 Tax=Ascidiimonas aurantiaca TaxID=1685432 RepID=UPI0030EEEE35
MSFGERLKKARQDKGLSQSELGKMVDVHYTQIGRYESKGVKPSGEVLSKIASTLGVTSDYLMSGSSQEQAEATLNDRELLNLFQRVEQLPQDKKDIVKELLESFLLKYDLQKRMT